MTKCHCIINTSWYTALPPHCSTILNSKQNYRSISTVSFLRYDNNNGKETDTIEKEAGVCT